MRWLCCILTLSLLATPPVQARARVDNSPAGVAQRARKHLASARKHFRTGEFEQAAKEWKLAYKLKAIPVLQLNMAQAYRLAGHYAEARFAYTQYLQEQPDPPNKAEVENRIRLMSRYLHHPPKSATQASP